MYKSLPQSRPWTAPTSSSLLPSYRHCVVRQSPRGLQGYGLGRLLRGKIPYGGKANGGKTKHEP